MPANLTPQYKEAEARLRAARTSVEKVACLEEMLQIIPKHKGTEKLQADLKRRLSRLQKAGSAETRTSRRVPGEFVEREGPKQIVLLGGPNAGKSALLAALTGAHPDVAPYPYTTTILVPGMMPFEDVKIQLVDSPALSREFARAFLSSQLRTADLGAWVVNLADDDLLSAVEELTAVLALWHVTLVPEGSPPSESGARELRLPSVLVGTHADDPGAALGEELLMETVGGGWKLHRVSAKTGAGIDPLRRSLFDALQVIRVYTKAPGKKRDMTSPYLLARGSTVMQLAAVVHNEFAEHLRFARIWGADAFDGQHVERDHVLADGDVVELHT